jgi:cytochrome c oxidase subunit 4
MSKPVLTLVGVWVALMALLTATVGATFLPLGQWLPVVNLLIAFAKAGLIYWFFMHVREQKWLARLVAVAAIAWLAILLGLTQADVLTRGAFGG